MKKILLHLVFGVLVSIVYCGCSQKEAEPKTQIVYETKEVVKFKPCPVPDVNCDFKGEGFVPTQKLLECVVEQKKALAVCR